MNSVLGNCLDKFAMVYLDDILIYSKTKEEHYRHLRYVLEKLHGFASLAAPLTELTKGTGAKKRAIVWTKDCQVAFEKLKDRMTAAPILVPPNPDAPYVVETNASDYAVGAVLLQQGDDGQMHPLAFESKKLSAVERNYPAQERELLAILHALRTWRCFIDGRRYTVFSDHYPLKYFRSKTKPTPRLTHWIAEIELYDPDIQYKPGHENHVPDLLSRRDGPNCTTDTQPLEPNYLYALKAIQESDWPKFYTLVEENWPPTYKDLLTKHKEKFVIHADQVFRIIKNGNDKYEARYVLFARHADLVQEFHKSVGHASKITVLDLMHKRWWWPGMRADIQEWLAACEQCQLAANADRKSHHAPMKPLEVPPAFSCWHLDFIGELPTTINDATGEAIANFLYEEIMMRFSCPNEILTDRGANFMSNVLNYYMGHLKINHLRTSSFHARTNSKVERTNSILKQMLRKFAHGKIHHWDQFVDPAVFACQVRKHRTTGFSPYFLVYGQEPNLPGDMLPLFIRVTENEPGHTTVVTGRVPIVHKIREARALAEKRLQDNAVKDKAKWDVAIKPQTFSVGDHVHTDRLRPIHTNSSISAKPWYDPTAARAIERRYMDAATKLAFVRGRTII
ncbi:hypothetical protein INT45_013897 [Circinella minor]|uniref:Integrase catalytic domain-containing protein n=1 Tax=Circinella minor TaxID=1195481 RepID=A0A8H7RSI5_9FUNG|nr:hypothetical protein INT45_013897 [Circinella minor]